MQTSRTRFVSLSTALPDANNSNSFEVSFSVFSIYDPPEEDEVIEAKQTLAAVQEEGEEEVHIKNKTPEVTPIERFKKIVRQVTLQNLWTREIQSMEADAEQMRQIRQLEDETGNVLTFNPSTFSAATNKGDGLSEMAKNLLKKPTHLRNAEHLEQIYKIVKSLTVFRKFPSFVKKELCKFLFHESFPDGKIIIQQGHVGFSLYFVVKGSVAVEVTITDINTGRSYRQLVTEIMAGGSFGEMALLQDTVREATFICHGNS